MPMHCFRGLILAVLVLLALAIIFPCPPWSLKGVVAQRAACMSNLKRILVILEEREIPLDADHAESVRKVLLELNLSCPEGSEVSGRPALYSFEANVVIAPAIATFRASVHHTKG